MRSLPIVVALMAVFLGCRPPYSLGPNDPLYIVREPSKAKHTILLSTVKSMIQQGKLKGFFIPHQGPATLGFAGGTVVGVYPNQDHALWQEIEREMRKAPNAREISGAIE